MDKRNMEVTVTCLVEKDGKYLMLHRKPTKRIMPGVWMPPGGRREFNEGVFACARREVKEETNLEIKNLKILTTGSAHLQDLGQELFFHVIGAEYASGELPNDPEDGELVWLSPEEILKLDGLLAELKEVLPVVFNNPGLLPVSYKAVYDVGNHMTEFELEKSA